MPLPYCLGPQVLPESELPVELYAKIGREHVVGENCSIELNGELVFCLLVVQMTGSCSGFSHA